MDFVGKRYWFFLFSALIILTGVVFLLIPPALHLGIDFTGGSTITVSFERPVSQGDVRRELTALGHPDATVQRFGDDSYFIRTRTLKEAGRDESGQDIETSELQAFREAFESDLAPIETFEFSSVSPVIAEETVRNSFFAVLAASIGILIYITWAFRRVPSPFGYGVSAILALVHDVLIVLGTFAITGALLDMEVNRMFIVALLTVIGYSVHDTIVVFDRIRENVIKAVSRDFPTTVNISIMETLGRSLNTSLTILFTILALILFGGPTIVNFLLVLLIGVIAGTYSSIGIASQFLVIWERGELGRLIRRIPLPMVARRDDYKAKS